MFPPGVCQLQVQKTVLPSSTERAELYGSAFFYPGSAEVLHVFSYVLFILWRGRRQKVRFGFLGLGFRF